MSSPGNKKQVSYIRRVAHLFIDFGKTTRDPLSSRFPDNFPLTGLLA